MHRTNKKEKILTGLLLGMILILLFTGCSRETTKTSYVFATLERGNIENVVSSSGTLETVGTVDVLSQMTGTVEKIYADYNETVTKGMPLIDLNTEILEIQAREAEASVMEAQATYDHTLLEYNNNITLSEKSLLSDFDLHASKTELDIAGAQLISAQAKLEEIKIELDQYALILSPITGIVLERCVEAGETVVSGTSATTLFTLARDLSQMEIHASVDELDISRISEGQTVRFTVDAYTDDTFSGTVRQIRLVPTTDDNVVTYTVIVDAENQENKLLPGMTANIDFLVEQKNNVLLVPNAALRFQPVADTDESGETEESHSLLGGSGFGAPPGGGPGGPGGGLSSNNATVSTPEEQDTLWYINDKGELASISVRTGVSDGVYTEVLNGPEELEGMQIIEKVQVEA